MSLFPPRGPVLVATRELVFGFALALVLALSSCGGGNQEASESGAVESGGPVADERPAAWFRDVAAEAGLDFVHFNGMSGEYFYPEIMAPGVAVFDYDRDGDLDVYIVQGQMLGDRAIEQATFPPGGALRDRLYRNDLQLDGSGQPILAFVDVTDASGIDIRSYGMGVAVGDIDNDGWPDLYRTGLNRAFMLHNDGDGTFTDITARTGTEGRDAWSVSAAFVDIDRDGWLDLYVGNYLIYSIAADISCLAISGQDDYCPPNSYRAQPDRLYVNRRDGTFENVTRDRLVGGAFGPALGVSTADFNDDGWIDIYIANDGEANQLWVNQEDGTFREMAFLSGAAVNAAGNAESSMGIDAGDFDNDGDEDLFLSHWLAQTNTLYVNDGAGSFSDRTAASGLGPPSLARTGFGAAWIDYDNDTWLDLLVVNGAVAMVEAQARTQDPFPLRERNQLFRSLEGERFEDVSELAGPALNLLEVSRGAAFGDVDNDGDMDVVIGNTAAPVRLLLNQVGNRRHWVGVRAVTGDPPRDALGARVTVERAGEPPLVRRARSDGSYASANDPRVLVGLGDWTGAVGVRVRWPDGKGERWDDVPIDRYTTLAQGTGLALEER